MAKKKCGMKGRIEKMIKSDFITCHRQKRKVRITVSDKGNKCTDFDCPFAGTCL